MNCGDNEMEYAGLIDGLHWAGRLDAIKLIIRGDSESIINELKGVSKVQSPKLRTLHAKVKNLLKKIKKDAVVEFEQLSKDENMFADCLANLGIDTQQNLTDCNWKNVNRFMKFRDELDDSTHSRQESEDGSTHSRQEREDDMPSSNISGLCLTAYMKDISLWLVLPFVALFFILLCSNFVSLGKEK